MYPGNGVGATPAVGCDWTRLASNAFAHDRPPKLREFPSRSIFSARPWRIAREGRALPISVALAVLVFFCGCQTTQNLFTASGPGWHVEQGQALWRPKSGLPEFGGDLVLASNPDGRALMQFDKTPLAMVFAQVTTNRWLIRFPQQQLSFSGHGLPPTRFAWLYLPAALDGQPLPPPLLFGHNPDGGWRLENTRTGEILEGYLSP
ncbi:MAG TPA: hypothetical protein VMA35_09075 [Candidatus Sulfopaludibacter sp.]|nr:hypothetical protein [Candidatus Sulfopaludibacter sp.]